MESLEWFAFIEQNVQILITVASPVTSVKLSFPKVGTTGD